MSYEQSKEYFSSHEIKLNKIIAELNECQPTYKIASGYKAIRISDIRTDDPVCKNNSFEPVVEIRNSMKENGIQLIDFKLNKEGQISKRAVGPI